MALTPSIALHAFLKGVVVKAVFESIAQAVRDDEDLRKKVQYAIEHNSDSDDATRYVLRVVADHIEGFAQNQEA